jgi:hypothetical protein
LRNSEIGKYLGMPTQGYIALSDAKQLDSQAGLETAAGAILAALSGINSISGPGMLDFESCQSLEKLVVDNEICGMTYRLLRGIEPREDFPAVPIFEELLRDADFQASIAGSVAQTADGASALLDLKLNTANDGDHAAYALRMLLDASAGPRQIDLKYTMIEDDFTETIQANGAIDGGALDLSATIIDDGADDYLDALYDIRLKVTPGMDSANGKDSFELTTDEEYQGVRLKVSGYTVKGTGEARVELTYKDEYDDAMAYLFYLPDDVPAEGAIESGVFELGGDDGYEEFRLTCAVRTLETAIDTDEFYIDPEAAVDIPGMSDVEEQAALSELEKVLYDTLARLEDAVPGLSGLTDELFGYTYDEVF